MTLVEHDPQSLFDPRGFDFTDWLAELGAAVTISTSTWTVTGPDALLTTSDPSIVTGSKKTQVKLSAGTLGGKYTVTNHVTASDATQDDRSFLVLVENL